MKRQRRSYPKSLKIEAKKAYASGMILEEVAQHLGVPRSTAYNWIAEKKRKANKKKSAPNPRKPVKKLSRWQRLKRRIRGFFSTGKQKANA